MKIFCTIVLFAVISLNCSANNLQRTELQTILKKGMSTKTIKLDNSNWPEVEIKARINASPLSAVAIFAAYDYQKNYIPNLLISKIHKQTSPVHIQVRYEIDMPWPLENGKYINDHQLTSPHADNYKVSWVGLSNTNAKSLSGSATFLPFPSERNTTLIIYKSRIDPKSFFAGLFRKLMVKDVEKSLKAVIETTERLSKEKSTIMLEYENKIIKALAGKLPY